MNTRQSGDKIGTMGTMSRVSDKSLPKAKVNDIGGDIPESRMMQTGKTMNEQGEQYLRNER